MLTRSRRWKRDGQRKGGAGAYNLFPYSQSASCKDPHSNSYTDDKHTPPSLPDPYDMGMTLGLHHVSVRQENDTDENLRMLSCGMELP